MRKSGNLSKNQLLKEFFTSTNSKTRKLKLLYQQILRYGSVTSEMMIDETHIKPATCARLLDELAQNNLILTNQLGESTGGRKPILYRINPAISYLIGIEITLLFSTILLMDMELSIIDKIKLKTTDVKFDDALLNIITNNIKLLLTKNKLNNNDILGIGLSIDDLINKSDTKNSVKTTYSHLIKQHISSLIPTTIIIGNATHFAALAEYKLHYANCSKRLLFTRCDLDIHSSTIIAGEVPTSELNMSHAFGHTTIDINGEGCSCGSFGCLHQYSSLPAIKNHIIEQLENGEPSIINQWIKSYDDIDYHLIFKAIEDGDVVSLFALEQAAYYYSIALFNYVLAFQPDTVICGGTLVPKGNFFNTIKKNIEKKLSHYPQLNTKIYPAYDSYELVSQGAGCMVLKQLIK